MDKKELEKNLDTLGRTWYQSINFDGIITRKKSISGEKVWNLIKETYLPKDIKNKRILDLGCNAGYYCVEVARLGAEVIGIEQSKKTLERAKFTKRYFEDKYNKSLNIKFINKDISDLDFESLGSFDYIFALAILYHIGKHKYGKHTERALSEQKRVIEKLTKLSNKIIVRTRNSKVNNVEYYSKIFEKFNFKPYNIIKENKKRSLVIYKMGIK